MIQKTATNEESEGEADKDTTPLTDRAASLEISKASPLKIEDSSVEDVDAEGVRHSCIINSLTHRLFSFILLSSHENFSFTFISCRKYLKM